MHRLICTALLSALAGHAAAQNIASERTVSMSLATELAASAVASCTAAGYNVVAAVVDRAGSLKALQRADNARPHAIDIAWRKAHTAAMLGYPTALLAENIHKGVTPASILNTPTFTSLLGGFPLKSGTEVIGGIGVSGAPGGHLDTACVQAALEHVQDRLK